MKKENDRELKILSGKKAKIERAEALIDCIRDSYKKDSQAIYSFVEEKLWLVLGFERLEDCTDGYSDELPHHSTMLKKHKHVVFQKKFLPETKVGDIKSSVLDVICLIRYTDRTKEAVASKMLKSKIGISNLTAKDIKGFIKSSEIVLSPRQKEAALNFVKDIVTEEYLDGIDVYFKKYNLSQKKCDAFFLEIARKFRSELRDSFYGE